MYLQFLDLKKLFNWLHNEYEKLRVISAKRLGVLCFINKDNFLHEAAAKQNLVSALARNNEAHKYNVQMQVRQLENEADARFFHRPMELSS